MASPVLFAAFWEPDPGAAEPVALASLAGGSESCDAHIAAKLPGAGAAGFVRPKKFESDLGAALLGMAGSMVEVTVKVGANGTAHSTQMHLGDQLGGRNRRRRAGGKIVE